MQYFGHLLYSLSNRMYKTSGKAYYSCKHHTGDYSKGLWWKPILWRTHAGHSPRMRGVHAQAGAYTCTYNTSAINMVPLPDWYTKQHEGTPINPDERESAYLWKLVFISIFNTAKYQKKILMHSDIVKALNVISMKPPFKFSSGTSRFEHEAWQKS